MDRTNARGNIVQQAREHVTLPLYVMIRPRGGNFEYTSVEFEQMKSDISNLKALGVDGFVFGILKDDQTIQIEQNSELVALASPLPCSFHRAFDAVLNSKKALEDLRDKYNKLANSSFSYADKESLRKSYSDMVEQVNGINRFKQATKHFDAHLSENTLEDREKFLSTFDATNQRLSFALKSKQTKNVDIINQLADLESNRVGSILYNPEDLAVYKSSYFSTDQDLNAGMEMQYNYAIKNVADDKIYDYEKQISDIDDKIKDTYNQDQKNQLAIQKNSLNQELSYVKKLSEKLKPLTVEDTYLQSFYPEEYSRKKAKQKQEVFKNERLAEGDQGSWAETLGRNWDNYTSNVAMQLSGIHSLLGDHSGAYRLKSKADYIAPPTFFVGKDLNKNNKIDDSEITRDIHDNRVTFSQVSWTDKNETFCYYLKK